jgi:2',3'-cyclic-nucleotide 2'-phosphodiesterase (5'-nucleotidase family)
MNVLVKLLLLLPAALCAVPAGCESTLTIYYSASLNGNLDGCTCDLNPVAGLVKRAAFLRTLETSSPTCILDAGDIFDEYTDPDLEKHILEVYGELSYDAVALGDQELAASHENLLLYRAEFPLICHNLFIQKDCSGDTKSDEQPFTPAAVVVEREGLRIGILSLLDPAVVHPSIQRGMRIADPIPAAESALSHSNRLDLDLTILLYHGPFTDALELVNACHGIDVVIFAHEQKLVPPRKIGTTVFASPGNEGNYLGELTLFLGRKGIKRFESDFRFYSYEADPDDPAVRRRIDTYRKKLRSRLY